MGCNCSKNKVCLNSNSENFCKGLALSERKLDDASMQQISEMIKNRYAALEKKLIPIIVEQSHPQIFKEISKQLAKHNQEGF